MFAMGGCDNRGVFMTKLKTKWIDVIFATQLLQWQWISEVLLHRAETYSWSKILPLKFNKLSADVPHRWIVNVWSYRDKYKFYFFCARYSSWVTVCIRTEAVFLIQDSTVRPVSRGKFYLPGTIAEPAGGQWCLTSFPKISWVICLYIKDICSW